jgi:hypothetical protein
MEWMEQVRETVRIMRIDSGRMHESRMVRSDDEGESEGFVVCPNPFLLTEKQDFHL